MNDLIQLAVEEADLLQDVEEELEDESISPERRKTLEEYRDSMRKNIARWLQLALQE